MKSKRRRKKKTIKIDFRYFWWYFDPNNNLFTNLLRKDYNLLIDKENPDYVFFSVFTHDRPIHSKTFGGIGKKIEEYSRSLYSLLRNIYYFKRERWKMPILKGDFVKIFYTGENARPNMDKCDWAFTYDYNEELKHPKHLRLPSYYFFSAYKGIPTKKNIEEIKNQKTKFCCFVYDNKIKFRERFFKKLSKYKKIDAPGLSMRNMSPEDSQIKNTGDGDQGKYQNKVKFATPYKFEVAFENSSYPGFTSEKICQCMQANIIPIYWGNSLIHREFNTKSFVNYHDFEKEVRKNMPKILFKIPFINWLAKRYIEESTLKRLIKKVIEIDNDDKLYEKYLKQPYYNDNKPSKYVDEKILRDMLRKIFG